jgi:hypothetical protein
MLSAFGHSWINSMRPLEIDKSENVRFYKKFGFTVVGQADPQLVHVPKAQIHYTLNLRPG